MLKTEKVVQIKTNVGRHLRIIREHYIREDVPCYSSMCIDGCNNELKGRVVSLLPKDVTHYVIPDCDMAKDYLELLEVADITAIIFLQTVVNAVQHEGGRRHNRRVMNLVHDPHKKSTIFHNEFQKYAFCTRQKTETKQEWRARSIYEGAAWYYNHLAGQIPIIVLTSDKAMIEKYGDRTKGVFVITLDQYLSSFWPDLEEAHTLNTSLSATLKDAKTKVTVSELSGYLPTDILETGLKVGRFIQGRLNVNKHNPQNEAFVSPSGAKTKDNSFKSDLLISGSADRNHTIHGDTVVVEVLPRGQWTGRSLSLTAQDENSEKKADSRETMPTGRVVGVVHRGWRDYVATFSQEEQGQRKAGRVLVLPWDRRVPKIRISTSQVDALRDHRILVRIDSWDFDSQYPNGHFVRSLGPIGEVETETAAILIENSITNAMPFAEAQLKELPINTWDHPYVMDPVEIAKRRDLRESHLIFSIDPKGCEDVDDTLSVRRLKNGNLELGVHIADVTYFVPHNSLTDLEARSRATTVYLADRRYDMLPEVLSADLCSLLGGVDRYAMSVIWELDKNNEVIDVWYGRTVIRSSYKLFYEIAQQMYDKAPLQTLVDNIPELQGFKDRELHKKVEDLRWAVSTLIDVARAINAKRTSGGALVLEGVEVQVQFTDNSRKTIEDLLPKQPMEIHETIAECMIFANHWVAKKICQSFPNQALLRHHPLPRQEHFDTLIQCAKSKGFDVHTKTNKDLADSLDKCVDPNDPYVNKLLRSLATQAMSNAEYFSTGSLARTEFFHYGLALNYYTHFTSPIRRYADVIVHRLLLCAIGRENSSSIPGNKALDEMTQHMNIKHRAAQYAQKESLQLFQMLFFSNQSEDELARMADAVIFQIRTNGVIVFLPRYGLKSALYLRSKDHQVLYMTSKALPEWTAGALKTNDNSVTVNSVLGSQTYKLFDHITVQIRVQQSHAHAASVKLELVSKKPYKADQLVASNSKEAKAHIIQMVTSAANIKRAEKQDADLLALGENFPQLKAQYGQTPEDHSLYHLFQRFRETALLDT